MSRVRALERLVADAKGKSRAFKRDIEQRLGRVDWNAPVDIGAVRASLRKAAVDAEVERRIASDSEGWLREAEVEKILGLGRTTLWNLRREDPTFPQPHRPTGGRAMRYSKPEVLRWKAAQERKAKGQA